MKFVSANSLLIAVFPAEYADLGCSPKSSLLRLFFRKSLGADY